MILAEFERMTDGDLYKLHKDALCDLYITYQTSADILNTTPNRNTSDEVAMIHRFKRAAIRAKRILGHV